MSIHAELRLTDGRTLKLTDVPVPAPATRGKATVHLTYPAQAEPGAVFGVVIHAPGGTFQGDIRPFVLLSPGETLSVEVGEENMT